MIGIRTAVDPGLQMLTSAKDREVLALTVKFVAPLLQSSAKGGFIATAS